MIARNSLLRFILSSPKRQFTSDFSSTFTQRAAGKSQLKEFYKHTHPDFFTDAPGHIKSESDFHSIDIKLNAVRANYSDSFRAQQYSDTVR